MGIIQLSGLWLFIIELLELNIFSMNLHVPMPNPFLES